MKGVHMSKQADAKEWFKRGYRHDTVLSDSEQAIKAYKKSIAIDDSLVDAHVNLGFLYLQNDESEKAVECFSKVIELEPDNPEAYNDLGYAYERLERFGSAKQMFE